MPTKDEIYAKKTAKGGWKRADLAEWGVPWPPPKGWLDALITGKPSGEIEMRVPCCTVSFSGSDHFPKGTTWYVEWLPKGYGPSAEDRLICAFPDSNGEWADAGYGLRDGNRPPLIAAVVKAIEEHLKAGAK